MEILVTMPKAGGELCIVRGAIRQTDGFPLPDVIVRAFDRDMRTETLLGQAVADTQGFYEIAYTTGQLRRPEKARADLIIRAFEPEGNGKGHEIAVSGIVFNVSPQQSVDLEVELEKFRGPSEYERYLVELQPLIESVPTHELTKEDLHFLGGKNWHFAQTAQLFAAGCAMVISTHAVTCGTLRSFSPRASNGLTPLAGGEAVALTGST